MRNSRVTRDTRRDERKGEPRCSRNKVAAQLYYIHIHIFIVYNHNNDGANDDDDNKETADAGNKLAKSRRVELRQEQQRKAIAGV